jgi:monothiol glutaredoxin
VEILDFVLPDGTDYGAVDVLSDAAIRDGIKEFSDWPTIPQLYAGGEFVGGCDIVKEMFQSGEIYEALGVEKPVWKTPSITISDEAVAKIKEAMGDDATQVLSMQIDAAYSCGLRFTPMPDENDPLAGIKVESNGMTIFFDPISSQRADGLSIHYEDSDKGEGFTIDNPNSPPPVKEITVKELKSLMDAGEVELFDIRAPQERETANIEASKLMTPEMETYIMELDHETPIYFMCHHGSRSLDAAGYFRAKGFRAVASITGGIDAWSQEIDSDVPRY